MSEKTTLADIEARLQRNGIHEIRQIARACGVQSPTSGKKERIIADLMKIASGEEQPVSPSLRGAPPKSQAYDRLLVADIERCRAECIARRAGAAAKPEAIVQVESPVGEVEEETATSQNAKGVLYFYDKYAFLSVGNSEISRADDIFVHESFVRRFNLKEGDEIECAAQRKDSERAPALVGVLTVNGLPPSALTRAPFDGAPAVYPYKKIPLAQSGAEGRIIDLFSPLAAGQRGLIVGSARRGATTLLYKIATALRENHEDICTVCLLVGARPEEISDFKAIDGATVFHTAFHFAEEEKARVADLALEYCKRQAELGKDVVLLLDNANRLARAYGFSMPKNPNKPGNIFGFISSARATKDGGSLSVISALSLGDNPADESLYVGLRDACNMQITLSDELAIGGLYPAIDVKKSLSAHAEKFCLPDDVTLAASARSLPADKIINEAHISCTFAQFKNSLK